MGGDRALFMWLLLLLASAESARGICPAKCRCNEDVLRVSCARAGLEVFPIQLNPEIRHIDLADNRITSIHFTLTFYGNLVSLGLAGNKIQTLGSANFESQRSLRQLNLSTNEIDKVARDSFRGLCALVELDLSYNRLEEMPAHAFRDLHSLEVLNLTGNQIVYLEEGLLKPPMMLRVLLLDNNQLLEMPSTALSDASNLELLSLSRNLIVAIEENEMPTLPALESLLLDSNVIREVHPLALSGLSSLGVLDLSDNNFTSIPTVSLAKLSNLTTLKLSGNFMDSLQPVALKGLFQLRSLHLDRLDFLVRIDPRAFVDNINLEQIWLDDNIAFQGLPVSLFYGNPRVSHISIRNNQLALLEVSHFPLDQLRMLRLGGNPLECNCSLMWLWRLGQEQMTRAWDNTTDLTLDLDEIRCSGPKPLSGRLLRETTESQVGCSVSWIVALSAVAVTLFVITIGVIFLYFGPMKKRKKDARPRPPMEMPNSAALCMTYEDPRNDKFVIGPPIMRDYRALPPWDPYSKDCADVYRQFDNSIVTRPHIVYV